MEVVLNVPNRREYMRKTQNVFESELRTHVMPSSGMKMERERDSDDNT